MPASSQRPAVLLTYSTRGSHPSKQDCPPGLIHIAVDADGVPFHYDP